MLNDTLYIMKILQGVKPQIILHRMDNQSGLNLPVFDMNELQPIPAFQNNQNVPVEKNQNTSLVLIALIVIVIAICVLIFLFIKLNRQIKPAIKAKNIENKTQVQAPVDETDNLEDKKEEVIKQEQPVETKEIIVNSAVENENNSQEEETPNIIEYEKVDLEENDNTQEETGAYSLKLGTPRSLEKCIMTFLKITKEN